MELAGALRAVRTAKKLGRKRVNLSPSQYAAVQTMIEAEYGYSTRPLRVMGVTVLTEEMGDRQDFSNPESRVLPVPP